MVELIILAAGQGTRMRSRLPKVLHPLAGRPLLRHVLERTAPLAASRTHIVYGHGGEQVQAALAGWPLNWVEQQQQRGTGHAVQQAITEVNSGIMALPAQALASWLQQLRSDNAQGELYLTDVIALAVADGVTVTAQQAADPYSVAGVNDRVQLAELERIYQRRQAEALMRAGVTLADPARLDIRGTVQCGIDVRLDCGVILEGEVILGDGVVVGAHSLLRNCRLAAGVVVEPMSLIDGATVAEGCVVGPYARLRPGSDLHAGARIGNFVEVKKSTIGAGSKVNHLSYIGDTVMGQAVNIGAGTITCNYDGVNKHQTVIGDGVFVGSDTQLVAPVTVGAGATIGAGSTITREVPAAELTLSRSPQRTVAGWQRPQKGSK